MKNRIKIYQEWLSNPYSDEAIKGELRTIEGDENEIKERFYMNLGFGTAGLRDVVGAGINRMNIYVIRRATQDPANHTIKQGGTDKGVAAAYDSRHMSLEFVMEAAMTLAVDGIRACKFESLCPTPELSFVVRELGCIVDINITISHNPSECNGYKVYWKDGAQSTPPHDKSVTDEVLAIKDLFTVKTTDEVSVTAAGKYQTTGKETDDRYIAQVKAQVVNWKVINEMQGQTTIMHISPHGTSNIPVKRMMEEIGFTHVYVVPEQELPDGDLPTVSYPNPEAEEASALGLKLAREKDADLAPATDPDADRLGVHVKDARSDNYISLIGDMSGSLLYEYVLSQKQTVGKIPAGGQMIKSIVSTNLIDTVTEECGCRLIEMFTGFKRIGQQVPKNEKTGQGTYLSGTEESYSCLIGTYIRDKDATSAMATSREAVAYYKQKGMTLWDAIVAIYDRYDYYKDAVKPIGLFGIEELAKIRSIMETLWANTPGAVGSYKIISVRNYKLDTVKDMAAGEVKPTGFSSSNVLYYNLSDGAWICVRPSGMEPKIKFYYRIKGSSIEDVEVKVEVLGAAAIAMVDQMT